MDVTPQLREIHKPEAYTFGLSCIGNHVIPHLNYTCYKCNTGIKGFPDVGFFTCVTCGNAECDSPLCIDWCRKQRFHAN